MKVVVVMPFDDDFDPVFSIIDSTVNEAIQGPVQCIRVDQDLRAGRISGKLDEHLRTADICIADLTRLRHNVLWEVGFIEALRKPLIPLIQSPLGILPFNIKDLNFVQYHADRLEQMLAPALRAAVRATVADYAARPVQWTIAIMGSRSINPKSALNMVDTLASPFLGPHTVWYCGTDSAVSQVAARFLLERRQRVFGVYTTNHRVLPDIAALYENGDAALLNVDHEQLPQTFRELGRRNSFLVARADLMILIWDGKSENTKVMHDWLTLHNRNHVVGFTS